MKTLIYKGFRQKAWDDVPNPIAPLPTEAIIRMVAATICDTDLHILKGHVPVVTPGCMLGHKGGRHDYGSRTGGHQLLQ
ncbi:MAG: alcohol dehydrogenase catalytic domain-containing protein [Planctomycetota bacterium]